MISQEFLNDLNTFVSFKSISTDPAFKLEMEKASKWLSQKFIQYGFHAEIWTSKKCSPVVFAASPHNPNLQTVLIYGHYDVQPAELSEGWKADPFSLRKTKKSLIARGVVDNKGQILTHIHTTLDLWKKKQLKYNVKFLIEGDEETGGDELPKLIKRNAKKLSCDVVLISDGEIPYAPTIEYSLRGGFNASLKLQTLKGNQHSGIYGGALPSATWELTKFLGKLFDAQGLVAIPGFYQGVDPISDRQKNDNLRLMKITPDILAQTGAKKLLSEEGLDFYTQTGLRPTIQITSLKGGYAGEGFANIVSAHAEAKLNFRLVTSQDPEKVKMLFEQFAKRNLPTYVDYQLHFFGLHSPVKLAVESPWFIQAGKILEKVYGVKPMLKPVGGALPVVADFKKLLGVDTLLVSLANDDCNMHGIEENFDIELLEKGLAFSKEFFGPNFGRTLDTRS